MELWYISISICRDRDFSSVGLSLSWIFFLLLTFFSPIVPKHMATSTFSRAEVLLQLVPRFQVFSVQPHCCNTLTCARPELPPTLLNMSRSSVILWPCENSGWKWSPDIPPSRQQQHQLSKPELFYTMELWWFSAGCLSSCSAPHFSVMHVLSSM